MAFPSTRSPLGIIKNQSFQAYLVPIETDIAVMFGPLFPRLHALFQAYYICRIYGPKHESCYMTDIAIIFGSPDILRLNRFDELISKRFGAV